MFARMKAEKHPYADRPEDDACALHQISRKIGERAGNLFRTRQLWCSGAALVALNHALDGGLSEELAIRLTSGLSDGMGGSGCLCGALNGGALALGIFLGSGRLAPNGDQRVLRATHELHNSFKAAFGSTCCRTLIKGHAKESGADYRNCAARTAKATELSAALILDRRPELTRRIDWDFLNREDGIFKARIKIATSRLTCRSAHDRSTAEP